MHGATWYIEEIASLNWDFSQEMVPVLALNLLAQLFLTLGIMTINNLCSLVCSNDIQAFSLTKLPFVLQSIGIIRMDLNTEPVIGI